MAPIPRRAPDGPATLDPYDRDLVPDTLRAALTVPTRADQDERLAALNAAAAARPGTQPAQAVLERNGSDAPTADIV